MAARKASKKKAARKKASKKKAVRKKAGRKKSSRKKAGRKKGARKKASRRGRVDLVGSELPKSLKAFGRQLRRDLNAVEKQIEVAGKDTRRSLARIMRDASHQLGALEARGEREWRKLSRNAEKDIDRMVKRVRKALS